MRYDVYQSTEPGDSELYSKGVTRDFGTNKIVNFSDGGQYFCSVMPLKVDPDLYDMKKVGHINSNPFTD